MIAILNIPISEGGTNSSHTHNLAKIQSCVGFKLLLSAIEFMTMVNSMLIYHRFKENECMIMINVCHMLVNE